MINKLLKNLIIFAIFTFFFIPVNGAFAFQAEIKMAHNDGAQCFLNGRELFNNLNKAQTQKYWNKELDVDNYLVSGQNLIACRVSNGDGNRGTLSGYFDLELIVDSLTIISRGSGNWKYFGSSGSTYPPYIDSNGRSWYDVSYNESSWSIGNSPFDGKNGPVLRNAPDNAWFRKYFNLSTTTCSNINNQIDCQTRSDCYWTGSYCTNNSLINCSSLTTQSVCQNRSDCYWNGSYCTTSSNLNNCAYQNNRITCLNTSGCIWTGSYCINTASTTCSSFTTQIDCLNRTSCYWTGSYCTTSQYMYNQENYFQNFSLNGCWKPTIHQFDKYKLLPKDIKEVTIESVRPLITGLSKYGNEIEVFIDNKTAGKAVVKEGEYSGVSNFYFKPKENFIDLSKKLETHEIKLVATNPRDNTVCTTEIISFIVVPYPAPIIHRFGEIDYVQRANILTISTRKPLITGLVKYGSTVEIYIDDKLVGKPKIKEGQNTGVANFYMTLPTLTPGQHTLYAVAKKATQGEIESPPSQIYTFTLK